MKAVARREAQAYAQALHIRGHELRADEPPDLGGGDVGPTPQELLGASLAACVAITVEMYAARKGWDVSGMTVECDYTAPERDQPTHFRLDLHVPDGLDEEQADRLRTIAGKCPVHRILEGATTFEEHVHREPGAPARSAGG